MAEFSTDERAIRQRSTTLGLLTAAYFFSYMDRQILAILQEDIRRELLLSDTQLGLLAGFAFAIFYATLGLPVARWADRGNRVNIIGIALALWSAMTAVCGLAQNFVQLLLARIGVGIGEAGSSPPSHSIIADLYPPEKRAGAMGIYSLGVVLGAAGGTMIGGTLAHFFGWRVAMFAVGIPGIVLAVVIKLFVVEPRRGLSDPGHVPAAHAAMPSFGEGFRSLFANRAAVHLVMGVTITSLIGYGQTAFGPSFLIRTVGLDKLQIAPTGATIDAICSLSRPRVRIRKLGPKAVWPYPISEVRVTPITRCTAARLAKSERNPSPKPGIAACAAGTWPGSESPRRGSTTNSLMMTARMMPGMPTANIATRQPKKCASVPPIIVPPAAPSTTPSE